MRKYAPFLALLVVLLSICMFVASAVLRLAPVLATPSPTASATAAPLAVAATQAPATATALPSPFATSSPPLAVPPAATVTATAVHTPAPGDPQRLLATLRAQEPPLRDLADLAQRLKPAAVRPTPPAHAGLPRTVGSKDVFWVTELESMTHYTVTATLRVVSPHLYMYVDDTASGVSTQSLQASADVFESTTFSVTRQFFGEAWAPGLDGDAHISVLHVLRLGATGAFSSADEESTIGNPYSNGRHMIYMNVRQVRPGTRGYDSVLAHEFQHALHFFQDRNEDAWINEGASMLSEKINGFSVDRAVEAFQRFPDTQLTAWGEEPDLGAHYGAALAFLSYVHERFGDRVVQLFIADPANGAAGIDSALSKLGRSERFDEVFADWLVANILDNPTLADGRFGHRDLDIQMEPTQRQRTLPASASVAARQYSGYYVEFAPTTGASVAFSGEPLIRLLNNDAHSGRFQWWSNRGDLLDATLTRPIDLTSVSTATLSFWTWYDLEEGWDYAYVLVSTDNGKTWVTLPTRYTTERNPVGNNLGHGYTGVSGGGREARWIEDRADLTPYSGRRVLLRFEYVTDDAVNNPGFSIDDVSIPEIGWRDDAESPQGWDAHGFVHSSNDIPQTFVVRLITFGQQVSVRNVPVDASGQAQVSIAAAPRAILVVSGSAPITTEPARFRYTIHSAGATAHTQTSAGADPLP